MRTLLPTVLLFFGFAGTVWSQQLRPLKYNHPGLTVDLGVGLWAWPLPMDWDGDGDLDLVVSCPDVPSNGTYMFENPGGDSKFPVFRPARKVGPGIRNVRVSYIDGKPRVLSPQAEWTGFLGNEFKDTQPLGAKTPHVGNGRVRANQWHYLDFDSDGALDLIVGVGYWGDYGWDDAFDQKGRWTRGPLRGYVFLLRNGGTTSEPDYASAVQLEAGGKPIDVYGMPSPCFADFDGDKDLDLICGEFMDGFTYFQNVGTAKAPRYAKGKRLLYEGKPLAMDLQMITPTPIDWDGDGDADLVVGDEDGRVALVEHAGNDAAGLPQFHRPVYFQQQADSVKFGALVTPVSVDWDADGDEDLICGNTAGYVGWIENLDGGNPPKWAAPVRLQAGDQVLRIQAGPNGSIQGPCEAKWGYTTLSVADWDHDQRLDLVVNSIWGRIMWYRNIGTASQPRLAAAQPVIVAGKEASPKPAWNWWSPKSGELVTQWRTTPVVIDWNGDGLNDLVMLDHEGYLALFQRRLEGEQLLLLPAQRVFVDDQSQPLRLNEGTAGKSGRRKLHVVDWDGDGRRDVLINSVNVELWRNVGEAEGKTHFQKSGNLGDRKLAGHTTSPTTVDWNKDGRRELLVGAEDGFLYFLDPSTDAPQKLSRDGITVTGRNFEFAKFTEQGVAFGNRRYVWFDVPKQFENWTFTRTNGGEPATMRISVEQDATLYMATSAGQSIDENVWTKVDIPPFGYTDSGRTKMQFYQRRVSAGTRWTVDPTGWTGRLLFLPPAKGAP